MHELERALIGDSAAAPASHILEGLHEDQVHRAIAGVPRTFYQEAWHIAFWQQMTLDWVSGVETPYPADTTVPFPSAQQTAAEAWPHLCKRLLAGTEMAAAIVRERSRLDVAVRCTSRPGEALRVMTVREQLESLAAHNAYHFGRIVLMRQLLGSWPPKSGGFSW